LHESQIQENKYAIQVYALIKNPFQLGDLRPGILAHPLVKNALGNCMISENVINKLAKLLLLENTNDLALCEIAFLYAFPFKNNNFILLECYNIKGIFHRACSVLTETDISGTN